MPIYVLNGKEVDVPENEVEQFLKAFPNAEIKQQTLGKPEPTSPSALVEPSQALNTDFNLENTFLGSQEDDTFIERQFGKNWLTDFWGDLYRAGEQGFTQAKQVGEAFQVFNKGVDADDETIKSMINARKEAQGVGMTDEMRDFQKIYDEEGKGVWGFIKGVLNNPSVIPQVFVSSMATLAGSALDSDEVAKAAIASAGAGAAAGGAATALAGGVGAIPGGVAGLFGGLGGAMEAGLTFGELLEKELIENGETFELENVKKLLQDEGRFKNLKRKAVGRGLTIGAIESLTGGLAGRAGATIRGVRGVAAGVGVEAIGGGIGEIAGRKVAGQEMDIAEIGFEAIGGTATAPFNLTTAVLTSPTYKINGQTAKRNDIINQIKGE